MDTEKYTQNKGDILRFQTGFDVLNGLKIQFRGRVL
jgi:hypothetical protein